MNDVFYYSLSFNLCILLFHFIPLSLPLTLFHLPLPLLFFVTLFFQLLLFFNFFKFLQLIGNSILYFFLFIQQYKSPFFPCCLLFVSLFLPLFFISQFIFFCSSASFFLCISSSSSALLSSVPLLLGFLCSFPPSTCTWWVSGALPSFISNASAAFFFFTLFDMLFELCLFLHFLFWGRHPTPFVLLRHEYSRSPRFDFGAFLTAEPDINLLPVLQFLALLSFTINFQLIISIFPSLRPGSNHRYVLQSISMV